MDAYDVQPERLTDEELARELMPHLLSQAFELQLQFDQTDDGGYYATLQEFKQYATEYLARNGIPKAEFAKRMGVPL